MLRVRGELTGGSLYCARKTMRVPLTGRLHLCGEAEAKARERFLGVSRAFASSGLPERAPVGRGWPGLAGWMKAQIRVKTRNRGRDWAEFRRPDEKKGCRGPRRGDEWRCS